MGLTKAILKFAAPIPKIEEAERFLFIGPHPDDIEIGAGATAAKFVDMGKTVRFLVCIDGRFGTANAPDPCVTSECHVDHLNVGNAAKQIAYFAPYKEIMKEYGAASAPVKALAYYMTAKPTQYIKTSGYLKKPLDAIFSCHLSQFPKECGDAQSIPLYLKLRSVDFGIRSLKGCAEGFRVLGVTQMHCLPEAGK